MTLIDLFKNALLAEIDHYLTNKGKTLEELPEKRKAPITILQNLVSKRDRQEWRVLKDEILEVLTQLKTGWLFPTGNSELKKRCMKVLNDSRFSTESFLFDQIEYITAENCRLHNTVKRHEDGTYTASLRRRISGLKKEAEDKDARLIERDNEIVDLKSKLKKSEARGVIVEHGTPGKNSPTNSILSDFRGTPSSAGSTVGSTSRFLK